MKITIDTKQDSKDEIRNAIRMLSSLIGHSNDRIYSNEPEQRPVQNIFESSSASVIPEQQASAASAFASIFGDSSPMQEVQQAETSAPEAPKEETPRVEIIEY